MTKWYVEKKVVEGKTFYYKDVGFTAHGKPSFRLWINKQFVEQDGGEEFIQLPLKGARIVRTEKGNLVLRPEQGWNTFVVGVPCGYRGESGFQVLEPHEGYEYKVYDSERGSLGVSTYALICTQTDKVQIQWWRTGRLYGDSPRGVTIYYLDHEETIETEDGIEDLESNLGGAE
jgi:hypothetical protein